MFESPEFNKMFKKKKKIVKIRYTNTDERGQSVNYIYL